MRSKRDQQPTGDEPLWLKEAREVQDGDELAAFFESRPELRTLEAVELLTREVTRLARMELPRAERLSFAASRLAELVGDDYGLALSLKVRGHLRYLLGRYEDALKLYRACQESFMAAGAEVETGLNLASSMWMLALLGRYEQAWEESRRAREILEPHGDPLLLARITLNEAQIFMRQDRHHDALERNKTALALYKEAGATQEVAVSLHNIAVSSIAIGDFETALDTYRELSAYCSEHELPLLAAQAEYNIAYLYFFRGEYARAIRIYQKTRKRCEELGDGYHLALCDLDQAEIYLELNLYEEAARLARLAFDSFEKQSNGYEAAKALSFLAIAASNKGDQKEALEMFSRARERFVAENNPAWVAMTDFYGALIHHEQMNPRRAQELCEAAREFFAGVPWPSRVALCDLLLAQIDLQQLRAEAARSRCREALEQLASLDLPALRLKAWVVLGRIEERLGDSAAAMAAYGEAHELLEDLRTHLGTEESKIAFLTDKLEVYESLVEMTLKGSPTAADREKAFGYVEHAKSRILADLVASGGSQLRSSSSDSPELVESMRRLREDLKGHQNELRRLYTRRATGGREPGSAPATAPPQPGAVDPRIEALEAEVRECEQGLLDVLRELRALDSEFAKLLTARVAELDAIRAALPNGASMLEYFECRGAIYAFVLGSGPLEVRQVARTSKLRSVLELFAAQMSKYQWGEAYMKVMGEATENTVRSCLGQLYGDLIEPVADLLEGDHLIVVPHGLLHQVPFHALWDGEAFLLDRYSFSYAPSASLFSTLQASPRKAHEMALVLGIPDEKAPEIRAEVEVVAQNLPGARVLVGEEATAERLRTLGRESRIVHIATHGFFRRDNPMFSAIQLGDSRLTLLDLYELELDAELVVLSGCSTGLNRIESGDELMGLTRGLLYSGASSLMMTLWDVHDKSTAALMKAFYGHLGTESNRARALRRAMRELRAEHPSPYYWAPFFLIGKYADSPH